MDQISINRIKLLHPKLRVEAQNILRDCEAVLGKKAVVRFSHTLRTNKEQDELYALGRTKPGKKVTNAKGGSSYHNYGLAIDIAFIVDLDNNGTYESSSWDTKKDWDNDKVSDWTECVKIFQRYGWEWGGNWVTFKDLPHFQKTFGYSIAKLKTVKKDQLGYVII